MRGCKRKGCAYRRQSRMRGWAPVLVLIIALALIGHAAGCPVFGGQKPAEPVIQPAPVSHVNSVVAMAARLQSQQVTVVTSRGQGSAVLFDRTVNGKRVQYAWTAAHVIQNRMFGYDGTGKEHFEEVKLVRQHFHDGRRAGETILNATVIAWSHPETGYDLALLKVDGRFDVQEAGVVFDLSGTAPLAGSGVYHVGSFLGLDGSCSFSVGVVAQAGRVLGGLPHEFDQITSPAFPGSSGGGVYDEDGRCIGLLVRGADATFGLVAPARLMIEWAQANGLMWALDPGVEIP
jgi:S1-C subfamily serine protease